MTLPRDVLPQLHADVDLDRRELSQRAQALQHAIGRGSSREEVGQTLAFLDDYVRVQLAAEERLMSETGFPGLAAHAAEHGEFARAVAALREEYRRNGASPSLVLRVHARLQAWLRDHVDASGAERDGSFRPAA